MLASISQFHVHGITCGEIDCPVAGTLALQFTCADFILTRASSTLEEIAKLVADCEHLERNTLRSSRTSRELPFGASNTEPMNTCDQRSENQDGKANILVLLTLLGSGTAKVIPSHFEVKFGFLLLYGSNLCEQFVSEFVYGELSDGSTAHVRVYILVIKHIV